MFSFYISRPELTKLSYKYVTLRSRYFNARVHSNFIKLKCGPRPLIVDIKTGMHLRKWLLQKKQMMMNILCYPQKNSYFSKYDKISIKRCVKLLSSNFFFVTYYSSYIKDPLTLWRLFACSTLLHFMLIVGMVRITRMEEVELGVVLLILSNTWLKLQTIASNKASSLVNNI